MAFNARPVLKTLARIGAVFLLHVFSYGALLKLGVVSGELPDSGEPWRVPRALALMALVNTCVLAYLMLRSRWRGMSLNVTVGVLFYGAHSVLQQLDSVAFPHVAPVQAASAPMLPLWLNAIFTLLFVPLAASILAVNTSRSDDPGGRPSIWQVRGLAWKVLLAVVLHQLVFVMAGYWIARHAAGSSGSPDAILLELRRVLREAGWLPGLQVFRALLWIGLSLPLVSMLRGPAWETSLAVGVCWATLSSGELVFFGSHSIDYVTRMYPLSFAGANFVVGTLVGALLLWRTDAGLERAGGRRVVINRF